jgi:hypothetical protein
MEKDLGLEFEHYMTYTLPWKLNLSKSKCVAVETKFSRFADFARMVAEKAPKEFKLFFGEFTKRCNQIEKWRAPKGYITCWNTMKGSEFYPNGKLRYRLAKKRKIKH